MKYLITFEKGESVRWLGHLDILRTFERAVRRANLPVAFSSGFNPRERIAFASALGVGVTAAAELATLELTESVEPAQIVERMNEKLPAGIRLSAAEEIPEVGSRDLLNSFNRAEMLITCDCPPETTPESAQGAADSLLARAELLIDREREGRTRKMDLRPLIHSIHVEELIPPRESVSCEKGSHDQATENPKIDRRLVLRMVLALGQDGAAKPQEIITLLAESLPGLSLRRAHRARLLTEEVNG